MGYTITYQPARNLHQADTRRKRRIVLTGIVLCCFVLLTYFFWPDGRAYLQSALIPGDAAVTVSAMEEFSHSLKNGIPFSDGLYTFCLRVLEGAGFAAN